MLKFLHAADVHLDSPLKGLERYEGAPVEEIRGATRRAFENLVELALAEEVAFLLLAGDLYDGDWKDYNTGLFFASQMRRLEEAGIPVFVIAGNHDAASQITRVLRPPANVRVLSTKRPETVVLAELEVALHGQGFVSAAVSDDLSAVYPAAEPHLFNVGLLHTSLDGRPGHAAYAPCTVDGLRSRGYQYWALGHVHEREVVCRDPWIVFPGVLQGRHARETGAKGATLVTVQDREVTAVEAHDLDVVRWAVCPVDAAGAGSAGEVLDRVQRALEREVAAAEGRTLAARLVIEGACPAHGELVSAPERWVQECRSLAFAFGEEAVWIEKVRIRTRQPAAALDPFAADDALGGLLRSIRDLEADDAELAELAGELAELRRKLPAELFEPADTGEALDPADPAQLRGVLADVRDLLLARLLATPEGA
ncbi:MAG TPA: DNA repair exonuclease [Thermoanaerobaculia bacterium]|nr:DNA repair exonuclease [Thermoanaerobaculia bacterium]